MFLSFLHKAVCGALYPSHFSREVVLVIRRKKKDASNPRQLPLGVLWNGITVSSWCAVYNVGASHRQKILGA